MHLTQHIRYFLLVHNYEASDIEDQDRLISVLRMTAGTDGIVIPRGNISICQNI